MSRYRWALSHPGIARIRETIAPVRHQVTAHPLYARLNTLEAVADFTTHHVYAVWDFMSLLKSLQSELTGVTAPWRPIGSPATRRLINDIVLAEESDDIDGEFISHFELYRRGMAELGADVTGIDAFLGHLAAGRDPVAALAAVGAPAPAAAFVTETCDMIARLPPHARAAAFAFGREDVIPPMFTEVLAAADDPRTATFRTYLARHVQVDEEEHAPMAMMMIADLCGDDAAAWADCAAAADRALRARLRFWDGVLAAIPAPAYA